MVIIAFIIALLISAVAGLPADWARRRATGETATALSLANGAGVLGAIAVVAAIGIVHGFAGIAALVLGIVAGQQLADALATRTWGAIDVGR